ncbi:MAG TPA: chemotaxis protein CheW [Gemmatimonadaceae bacterium]|nr:chemotaxis protein CheW [Gemmatimonadaceae bacterium]
MKKKTPTNPKPRARRAPRRVSSPVEIATALREEAGQPVPPPAAPTASVETAPAPRTSVPAKRSVPPKPDIDSAPEAYAAALLERLAAFAPDDAELLAEDEAARPAFRERVRAREGQGDLLMFRIGRELFAVDLAAVEEAVALPEIHRLPEMPVAMLGAFDLRGRLTPVYSPSHVIGVPLDGSAQAALLVRAGDRRLGLAVDDVEDVMQLELRDVRESPGMDDADGILLGVAHHGAELVAIIDADALVAACVAANAMEIA